jgi:hypothetical protein
MILLLLLLMVTLAEATIGVFVKLTDGRIPIHTLDFYALTFAAVFLGLTLPWATGQRMRIPWNNFKDAGLIGKANLFLHSATASAG